MSRKPWFSVFHASLVIIKQSYYNFLLPNSIFFYWNPYEDSTNYVLFLTNYLKGFHIKLKCWGTLFRKHVFGANARYYRQGWQSTPLQRSVFYKLWVCSSLKVATVLIVPDATADSVKIKHTSAVHPEDEVLRSQNSSDEALQLQSAAGHVELGQNP